MKNSSSPYCVMSYFLWGCRGILTLITLRSERVKQRIDMQLSKTVLVNGGPAPTVNLIILSSASLFRQVVWVVGVWSVHSAVHCPRPRHFPICASVTSTVTFNCPRHLPHQHPRPCHFHRHHPRPSHHPRVSKISRSSLIVFLAVRPMGHRIVSWLILYLTSAWRHLPDF